MPKKTYEMVPKRVESGIAKLLKFDLNALDDLIRLYPFTAVPINSFKVVISLEMKRKENDMIVISVVAEMQEMISILLDLLDIRDKKRSLHGESTELQ
ncbi:hypothetical protein BDQ17DRAFT_894791 [Cyathus striatus]|nr:hypothetical protein BDQ17DRAFT_894791 [Cyathus striatus]